MIHVYLDIPLFGGLLSWIQDATLLWMVAQIGSFRKNWKRYLAGGMVGGVFQFLLLINQTSGGLVNFWVGSPLVFTILVPLLMNLFCFYKVNFKKYFGLLGYFYLLSFLLSGIHWGIDSLNQRYFLIEISLWWRFILHITFILILGELGWGIVHRKIWEQLCLYQVKIYWDGNELILNALLDTGNRLVDPLTKVPVVIVEYETIKRLLPPEVISWIESLNQGAIEKDLKLPRLWEERIRVLPFKSIGNDKGLLIGFRPDVIKVRQHKQEIDNHQVVVGFYNKPLSPEGAFQALIPPTVLHL